MWCTQSEFRGLWKGKLGLYTGLDWHRGSVQWVRLRSVVSEGLVSPYRNVRNDGLLESHKVGPKKIGRRTTHSVDV